MCDSEVQKSNIFKVCVPNILRELKYKLDYMNVTTKLLRGYQLIIWLKYFHSSLKRDFSWATS